MVLQIHFMRSKGNATGEKRLENFFFLSDVFLSLYISHFFKIGDPFSLIKFSHYITV